MLDAPALEPRCFIITFTSGSPNIVSNVSAGPKAVNHLAQRTSGMALTFSFLTGIATIKQLRASPMTIAFRSPADPLLTISATSNAIV
jgi:hypothetical protein